MSVSEGDGISSGLVSRATAQLMDASIEKSELDRTYTSKKSGNSVQFLWKKDILVCQCKTVGGAKTRQVVVLCTLRGKVLRVAHDSPVASHLDSTKILARISAEFYWLET